MKGHESLNKGYKLYKTLSTTIKAYITIAEFGNFVLLLYRSTNDLARIYALIKRWWDTTNTFHMPFGEITITPLDFSLLTGISFGGWKLELIPNIHRRFDDVSQWLGTALDNVVVTAKWFHGTFADHTVFSDDQMTCAFLMYVLGCFVLSTHGDRIHLS